MRKRSKYRPKGVLVNPMGYIKDGLAPMTSHADELVTLRLKNHAAMVALLQGEAGVSHMSMLIAMYNITEALHKMGFGKEYADEVTAGRQTLMDIVHRSHTVGKYVLTDPEIAILNQLLELHDAQMEVITVREMDIAIKLAQKEITSGRATNLRKPQ
jgi:hypothetical protein